MGLLQDIQISLLDEHANIGPILLKLRFLADRLGSDVLEEWVGHETNGYDNKSDLPPYRRTSISYTGTFTNGYQTLNNVSVAPYMIKKHGGDGWVNYRITDSLAVIETMIAGTDKNSNFSIDTGNLKLLISNKIYDKDTTCIDLNARIDKSAFVRVISAVRSKLLDFTLELEKRVPISSKIAVGMVSEVTALDTAKVTQITQNIFNAPVNNITSTGTAATLSISVVSGNSESLERALIARGVVPEDAKELADIASGEQPEDTSEPFGKRAKAWIGKRIESGVDGVLKIGGNLAKDDIAELFKHFYDKLL